MKNRSLLLAIVASLSLLMLWGCAKRAEVTSTPETPRETAPAAPIKEEPKAEPKPEVKEEPKERAATAGVGVQPIYFDYDQSFVRDDAKSVMKANAEWLKANPKVKISIEGNSDERGTIEYNQALGQRRATSAKKYLADLGISAKRISLISYGKEKPMCTESTESCWQKNRRGDFIAGTE